LIWEAFVLVFIAELGDRAEVTTIFLARAPALTFTGQVDRRPHQREAATSPQQRPVPGLRPVLDPRHIKVFSLAGIYQSKLILTLFF